MPQEEEDDELFTVDDTDILGSNGQYTNQDSGFTSNIKGSHDQQQFEPGQASLSSSPTLALPQSHSQNLTAGGPPRGVKSSTVDSAARAAELRAKLLANRTSNAASRQGSPAIKSSEHNGAKKTNIQDVLKQTNGTLESQIGAEASGENTRLVNKGNRTLGESMMQSSSRSPGTTVTNMDFETLFAEAQNAADARKSQASLTNKNRGNETNSAENSEVPSSTRQIETATRFPLPALKKSLSTSELSEPGEIHSENSSPSTTKRPTRMPESTEAKQAKEDKNERLMRQNEVNKAYQPLKASRAPTSEPTPESMGQSAANNSSSWPNTSKASAASEIEPKTSAKTLTKYPQEQLERSNPGQKGELYELNPVHDESRRDQHRERARDYDRRDNDRNRRPSFSEQHSRESDFRREVEARRQKLMDDNARRSEENARRAAEYKKGLEAHRGSQRQITQENSKSKEGAPKQELGEGASQSSTAKDSGNPCVPLTNNNMGIRNDDSPDGDRDPDTVMLDSNIQDVEGNQDISDWLYMTNFHDQKFREKRLEIYRKKKALEIQQAELEREESELQGIPYVPRAQSILPASRSPKVPHRASIANPKMPPPPLPLKEANNDIGIKIKDSALSLGLSQSTTPTLKRQHAPDADDDTNARRMQPVDKLARLDMNGHAANEKPLTSPATVKGTTTPIKAEPIPLENRISRDDSDRFATRPRGRSRSPSFSRRSISPRRRYSNDYSPEPRGPFQRDYSGVVRDNRTCHNCGQVGHYQHQCTEPRRDGKEWNTPTSGYQQWVSPNYRGRNPLAREDCGPGDNRSRFESAGKSEEGAFSNPRENIGSRHLNLEAGGQYRLVRR